jgi:hypothetical protein
MLSFLPQGSSSFFRIRHQYHFKSACLISQPPRLGFKELVWRDVSGPSLAWYQERLAALSTQAGPPPLGLHLLLPDFGQMLPNLVGNREEDRMVLVQAVFERL